MSKLFKKKADVETKSYGSPTPSNPMGDKLKAEDDLKVKKPVIPGSPGNGPQNSQQNGPMMDNDQATVQASKKKAERTLLPANPHGKTQNPSPYAYDRTMHTRTTPIAEVPTKGGAPSWVTGSDDEDKTAARDNSMNAVANKHQLNIAIKTMKMPDAMIGVMGGMNKQQALEVLARNGYVWDDKNYMAGGTGLKRRASVRAKLLNKKSMFGQHIAEYMMAPKAEPNYSEPAGHDYCPRCLECTTCNLRPCSGGQEHLPGVDRSTAWDQQRQNATKGASKKKADSDPFPRGTMPAPQEARARNKANGELADLSSRYHATMPLPEIKAILEKNGFDGNAVDGVYTGREGRMNEKCGSRSYLSMHWFQLEKTKQWEITAYIS